MKNKEILIKLQQNGTFITNDHFEYTSGKHGDTYINKDAIYPHISLVSDICKSIALEYRYDDIEAVLAPATGGIVLTQWVAYWLERLSGSRVLACYADKRSKGGFIIRRGYSKLIEGRRTLVLEDIINTGGSVSKVIKEAESKGANVVGVACICNRGAIKSDALGVERLYSVIDKKLNIYEPNNCKLCQQKIPLRKGIV
jgi:orotate phosphoribosyltransferase